MIHINNDNRRYLMVNTGKWMCIPVFYLPILCISFFPKSLIEDFKCQTIPQEGVCGYEIEFLNTTFYFVSNAPRNTHTKLY